MSEFSCEASPDHVKEQEPEEKNNFSEMFKDLHNIQQMMQLKSQDNEYDEINLALSKFNDSYSLLIDNKDEKLKRPLKTGSFGLVSSNDENQLEEEFKIKLSPTA